MAARALLDLGHRKIAVIAGPSHVRDSVERIDGFMAELNGAGIDTGKLWVAESDFAAEGGWASAKELMASGYEFTALFCANDQMAVGVLSCFQQAGVAVPGKVSVLGYDDSNSNRFTVPSLSSVHIPWRDLAINGLNFLLNRCYGLERPVTRQLPISVTLRTSVASI